MRPWPLIAFHFVLSSLFCHLFMTLFRTCFASPYVSCCAALQLSLGTGIQRWWEAAEVWLPVTPLLSRVACPAWRASTKWLQPWLAAAGSIGRSTRFGVGVAQDSSCRVFLLPGPQLQIVTLASRLHSYDHRVPQRNFMWVIGKHWLLEEGLSILPSSV